MLKLTLLLNPIYVTLFWAITLHIHPRNTHFPKAFLGKFMAVAFLLYLSHFTFFYPIPEAYHYLDSFYNLFSLLLYPMYYIYIRLLTVDAKFELKKHYPYFIIPLVLFLLYGTGILLMTKEQHLDFVYNILPSKTHTSGIFSYQKNIYLLSRVVFVLQGIVYLYLSNREIKRNKSTIEHYYTNTESSNINNIYFLNLTLIFTMLIGIALSFMGKELFLRSTHILIFPSLFLSVLLFSIGLLGSMQKAVVISKEEQEAVTANEEKQYDSLSPHLAPIREKLLHLFIEERIYLNKDLTLWDITRTIGTNRTYISLIINNEHNTNFSSFVNRYRINYAKEILQKNSLINNQDLADMTGFGSVISLQRSFQQIENKSITKYKAEINQIANCN